ARTEEAVRVERAASAPLQLDDVAAVKALVELHLHALEWQRHSATEPRAAPVLEHLGDMAREDILRPPSRERAAGRGERHGDLQRPRGDGEIEGDRLTDEVARLDDEADLAAALDLVRDHDRRVRIEGANGRLRRTAREAEAHQRRDRERLPHDSR